jgi:hypothetical protein
MQGSWTFNKNISHQHEWNIRLSTSNEEWVNLLTQIIREHYKRMAISDAPKPAVHQAITDKVRTYSKDPGCAHRYQHFND